MLRMWGAEAYIGHWDGYGFFGNNFYLHADSSGRFTVLPWGTDQAFSLRHDLWTWAGFFTDPASNIRVRCMTEPACNARYWASVLHAEQVADDIGIVTRARSVHAGIRDLIAADPRNEATVEDSDRAVADIADFIAHRYRQLHPEQPGPEPGPDADPKTPDAGPEVFSHDPPLALPPASPPANPAPPIVQIAPKLKSPISAVRTTITKTAVTVRFKAAAPVRVRLTVTTPRGKKFTITTKSVKPGTATMRWNRKLIGKTAPKGRYKVTLGATQRGRQTTKTVTVTLR